MDDFLSFRKMITPLLIQVIFWLGVVITVISALITMFRSSFFTGLILLFVGPLLIRIYCELLILLFRMYDELSSIRKALGGHEPGGFPVIPIAEGHHATPAVPPVMPPSAPPSGY